MRQNWTFLSSIIAELTDMTNYELLLTVPGNAILPGETVAKASAGQLLKAVVNRQKISAKCRINSGAPWRAKEDMILKQ